MAGNPSKSAEDKRWEPHMNTFDSKPSSAAELERLVHIGINCFNIRDFYHKTEPGQEFLSHVSDKFQAKLDHRTPNGLTFMELAKAWEVEVEEWPECQFGIINISSDIDEAKGTATLHVECDITGRGDTTLMALSQLYWKRKNASSPWMYMQYTGMRNGFMNAGFV